MITSFPLHTSQCYLRLVNSSLKGDQKPFLSIMEVSLTVPGIIIICASKLTHEEGNLYFPSLYLSWTHLWVSHTLATQLCGRKVLCVHPVWRFCSPNTFLVTFYGCRKDRRHSIMMSFRHILHAYYIILCYKMKCLVSVTLLQYLRSQVYTQDFIFIFWDCVAVL
jgi:hypothetical protein